jgi:hypothetical protein
MQGQQHSQQPGQNPNQDMSGMSFDLTNGPNGGQMPQNGPGGPPGADQFGLGGNMDFAELSTGDVLDTFDFDSFLHGSNDPTNDFFDANMAFGDVAPMEADMS